MEKKQTAVDYAVEKLEKFISEGNQITIDAILEKAKEMEKQQVIEFLKEYDSFIFRGGDMSEEEYYNYIFEQE